MTHTREDKRMVDIHVRRRVLDAISRSSLKNVEIGPAIGKSSSFVNNTKRGGTLELVDVIALARVLRIDPIELLFDVSKESLELCRYVNKLNPADQRKVASIARSLIDFALEVSRTQTEDEA